MEETHGTLDVKALAGGYAGKEILITGSSGFLAGNLIEVLKGVDCTLRLVSRDSRRLPPVVGAARVVSVIGNISQRAVWEGALEGVDIVFHLGAQTSVYAASANVLADLESNVMPMVHLLETCRAKGWSPVVLFAGTVTEAGLPLRLPVDETHPDRPLTVYDVHKWMAEGYLKCYIDQLVVRGAVLRLANVYGPGPRSSSADRGVLNLMIRRALAGEPITIYGRGDYLRDYVYVEDVVRAFLAAGQNVSAVNGQHFVIGSGQGDTLSQAMTLVAERVAARIGRPVAVRHVEPPASLSPIETRNFVADSRQFTHATGWRARWSLAEGIDATIEAFA